MNHNANAVNTQCGLVLGLPDDAPVADTRRVHAVNRGFTSSGSNNRL